MKQSGSVRLLSRREFVKGAAVAVGFPYVITSDALGANGRPPALCCSGDPAIRTVARADTPTAR